MKLPTLAFIALAALSMINNQTAFGNPNILRSGPSLAPDSTVGLDIVLTIESTESTLPGGFPTMGAVVQSYAADGSYIYRGAGGPNQLQGTGTYTYTKTGSNTASEDAVQNSDHFTLPYHMEYTFDRPTSGHWIQYFAGGLIVFKGSFATSLTHSKEQWAPENFSDTRITLTSDEDERCGVQFKRLKYTDTTYSFQTSSRIQSDDSKNGSGTYVLTKMSARSLVEEGTNTNGTQYVRVYTFSSHHEGVWQEANIADGTRTNGTFWLFN